MTATKKRSPSRTRRMTKTDQLAKELAAVKGEVAHLRDKCQRLNRTLVRLLCPKEWFEEVVDDDELRAKGVEVRSFDEWIARLSK